MKTNGGNSVIGFLASTVFVAMIIGGAVFLFNYFTSAHNDITSMDVKITMLTEGTGGGAKQGDTVVVNYTGALMDGTVFDDSYKRGEPISVIIGEGKVIKGWEKGLLGIKKGEKRELVIPSDLGYGPEGYPDPSGSGYVIPPNSPLKFTVEAVDVNSRGYLQ